MAERLAESRIYSNNPALEEILKCFICLSKVVDPKLCPSCSKLCCNVCITRWLTEQRLNCPNCRAPLRPQILVSGRFIAEISQALDSLQVSKPEPVEKCNIHSTALNYFCVTCESAICSDCAMFGNDHKGHEFQHLASVHEKHVDNIKQQSQGLRKRLKDLTLLLHEIDRNIEKVRKSRDDKSSELVLCMEQMQARLEAQLKNKLQMLHEQRATVCEEIDKLENMHVEINKELSQNGKSKLISKTPELIKKLKELHLKPMSKFNKINVITDFHSEIAPNYDSGVFEIKNYSILRNTTEVVYSETLQSCGLS